MLSQYVKGFKKFKDFSGRSSRKDFWLFTVTDFLIGYSLILGIELITTDVLLIVFTLLSICYGIIGLIPRISIAVRRLHDTSQSGWWLLLILLPIIGVILLLIQCSNPSATENKYGPVPSS